MYKIRPASDQVLEVGSVNFVYLISQKQKQKWLDFHQILIDYNSYWIKCEDIHILL